MKAKIDEIWAIYKINLGQNSRWIKNWEQSGRWIAILPLESHLGRRINTDVIWAVRSCCMKEGKYHKKISDISPIFCHQRRFFQNISDISPRTDISPIFWRYLRKYLPIYRRYLRKYLPSDFSSRNIVSTSPDTRYIADISWHFPPWSWLIVLIYFLYFMLTS